MKYIHLNCDLGEGGDSDQSLMSLISACNIACGGHAGNIDSMRHSVRLAIEHEVEIGAHPSYPDKQHFGRKTISMSDVELRRSLVAQILSLKQLAEADGGVLRHVKPHGALYHDVMTQERIAGILIEAMLEFEDPLRLYVPPHSMIAEMAKGHLNFAYEAFADRRYQSGSQLVPRSQGNALITDEEQVFIQLTSIFLDREVPLESGAKAPMEADTFCVHSDTPNAVAILEYLHGKLGEKNIKVLRP